MNSDLVSRLAQGLAAKTDSNLPAATVTSYEEIGDGIAMVVVQHSTNAGRELNRKALAKTLGDKARPIEGSFRRINDAHQTRLVSVGYVVAAELVEELSEARESKMKVVAKNVLMDDSDRTLWDVTESNGQKYIRRQTAENINDVLSTIASTKIDVPRAETLGFAAPCKQDYVAYVDATTASLKFGYVVASDGDTAQVLPRDGDALTTIASALIVALQHKVDTRDNYLSRSLTKVEAKLTDPDKLKEYYKRVYSYDPAFLNLVEQTIDKSASL